MRFSIGIVIAAAGIVFSQLIASNWQVGLAIGSFADAFTLITILLCSCGFLVATKSMSSFCNVLRVIFSKKITLKEAEICQAIHTLKSLRSVIFSAGILIFLITKMQLIVALESTYFLAPEFFLAGLGIYYALAINLVFIIPAIAILQGSLRRK